jgi:hypothetical protein
LPFDFGVGQVPDLPVATPPVTLRKPKLAALRSLALLAALSLLGAAQIDPNRYLEHIKYLASPELKGRGTGTPELDKAAEYIAAQFRAMGLRPVEADSYFQPFPVTTNARLGTHNRFEYSQRGRKKDLKLQDDFLPFNFSASGTLAGAGVFAGYGITAPEYHYDDYAAIDVKDKFVLVLRHEPQEADEKSVFDGKMFTEHAQFWSKAVNAKQHGARGLILISDRANHPGESDELEKFGRTVGPADAGILFLQVKAATAEAWVKDAGRNLDEIAKAIDQDLRPQSFALPDTLRVSATIELQREVKTTRNVAGYLPGLTSEYVVIGAHYDHLGLGEQFSMAPSQAGTAHPGADDNASGTAGVLELARWFAAQPKQKRGILFLAFAGEELGLLGSSYWTNHPDLPLDKAVAMINLDMIGRLRDSKVYIGGSGSGSTFKPLIEQTISKHHLNADFSGGSESGASDHTAFTSKQVPVLFFFSGLHGDYHKPSDTWDKINAPAAAELLAVVGEVTEQLLEAPDRPQFIRLAAPRPLGRVGGEPSGDRPWFGSVPDFGEVPTGVKFADVQEGSPAQKAGLRPGDILIEFDGKPIQNLYDFTYALRARKPGDQVTVKVLRTGNTIEAKVVLAPRK